MQSSIPKQLIRCVPQKITTGTLVIISLVLMACGGGEIKSNPPAPEEPDVLTYRGPAPQTQDVQDYKVALWDNISTPDKCGACHVPGNQAPYFADRDNVNTAYTVTNDLVVLTNPKDSRLVTKMASNHNCWLSSSEACAETITQWIKNWASDRVEVTNVIEFTPPPIREAGSSKTFPDTNDLYTQHVYPLVNQYCHDCHSEDARFPQSPFFADTDIEQAYKNSKGVINLDDTNLSRLVIRLSNEFHNCWSDCLQNANEMLSAINDFSGEIELDQLSDDVVASAALRLPDGIVAASGGRHETNMIALYQFKAGEGNTAFDTSGVTPAAHLKLSGDYEWLGSWGLQFNSNARAQATTASSKKFHDLITLTGEFTIEAWLTPGNVTQEGPARIISYTAGNEDRNFTLGQTQYNYDFLLRTSTSDNNGQPALSTPDALESLQATLQHVVVTFNPINGRSIYINNQKIDVNDEEVNPIASWDDSYALILGNEASGDFPWLGNIRLLSIYNRVLAPDQIQQNYDVGVGERFYLLFSIGDLIDLANTYIVFDVSQFDNYSYLFNQPSLINLDGASLPDNIQLNGMRIGINGKESKQGQSYANLETELQSGLNLTELQPISQLGTIIGIEKSAENDEFFLTFEQLGDHENVRVNSAVATLDFSAVEGDSAHVGLKNFAEIFASMSELTQIPQNNTKVFNVYTTVKQQLPSIENVDTFISAQQMAVTQLAIAFCDQAVEDDTLRQAWWPDFDVDASVPLAFTTENRPNLITPIIERLMPQAPATQPEVSELSNELNNLVTRLAACNENCDAQRTKTITKASCAAVLASAMTLIQ